MRLPIIVLAGLWSLGVFAQGTFYPTTCNSSFPNLLYIEDEGWLDAIDLPLFETPTEARLGGYRIDSWNGGGWDQVGRVTFAYDARGNTTAVAVQLGDGGGTWENDERMLFVWDSTDRLIEKIAQESDGPSEWLNDFRRVYTYDSAGNQDTQLFQNWDSDVQAWVNGDRYFYEYDGVGQIIQSTQERWSIETEAWGGLSQRAFSYDAQGRREENILRLWDAMSNSYENNSRRFISLFLDLHPVEFIDQLWVGSSWQGSWRHALDGGGPLSVSVDRFVSGDWVATHHRTLTESSGRLIQEDYNGLPPATQEKLDRLILTYDAAGRVTSGEEYTDIFDSGDWNLSQQFSCTRDAAGRILEQADFFYSGTQTFGNREVHSYDGDGVLTEELGQEWNGSSWVNEYRLVAFDLITATEPAPDNHALSLTISPNPATVSANLHINVPASDEARVEVYDALGRLVAVPFEGIVAGGVAHEVRMSTSGLPAGIYITRATIGQATVSTRFIIIR